MCHRNKPVIFSAGQFPLFLPEQQPLDLQKGDPVLLPAQEPEQSVECGQHGVNGGRSIALGQQVLFPAGGFLPRDGSAIQPTDEGADIPQVLFNGAAASLFALQILSIGVDLFRSQETVFHRDNHSFHMPWRSRRGAHHAGENHWLGCAGDGSGHRDRSGQSNCSRSLGNLRRRKNGLFQHGIHPALCRSGIKILKGLRASHTARDQQPGSGHQSQSVENDRGRCVCGKGGGMPAVRQ